MSARAPRRPGHRRWALRGLTLLLAAACVVGAVAVGRVHAARADDRVEQERYGEVLRAATAEAEAFINIDYREAQQSIDAVAAGATGTFRKQYDSSTEDVVKVLRRNKSVMDGSVVWAGVVAVDQDSATVLAATTGTVANTRTKGDPVARTFRLRLELTREDGRWLTDDLQFVG